VQQKFLLHRISPAAASCSVRLFALFHSRQLWPWCDMLASAPPLLSYRSSFLELGSLSLLRCFPFSFGGRRSPPLGFSNMKLASCGARKRCVPSSSRRRRDVCPGALCHSRTSAPRTHPAQRHHQQKIQVVARPAHPPANDGHDIAFRVQMARPASRPTTPFA
jgi:hypothetical protein